MKKYSIFLLVWVVGFGTACKSQFEKVRESGDPALIYQKANEFYEEGDYLRAQMLFELAIPSYRGKEEAEELFFRYADTHYKLEKFIMAAHYFERFGLSFPNSPLREDADYLIAHSYYRMSPRYRLDQTYTQKSIDAFQVFANTYPKSDKLQGVNLLIDDMRRKLEQKAFAGAVLYYDLRRYQSAIQAFDNLLKDFPETPDAEKVRYLIVKSHYELAKNSVRTKQEERFQKMLEINDKFVKRYPQSEYTKELIHLSETAQDKLKSLKDA